MQSKLHVSTVSTNVVFKYHVNHMGLYLHEFLSIWTSFRGNTTYWSRMPIYQQFRRVQAHLCPVWNGSGGRIPKDNCVYHLLFLLIVSHNLAVERLALLLRVEAGCFHSRPKRRLSWLMVLVVFVSPFKHIIYCNCFLHSSSDVTILPLHVWVVNKTRTVIQWWKLQSCIPQGDQK
jgi:hypothetical protein